MDYLDNKTDVSIGQYINNFLEDGKSFKIIIILLIFLFVFGEDSIKNLFQDKTIETNNKITDNKSINNRSCKIKSSIKAKEPLKDSVKTKNSLLALDNGIDILSKVTPYLHRDEQIGVKRLIKVTRVYRDIQSLISGSEILDGDELNTVMRFDDGIDNMIAIIKVLKPYVKKDLIKEIDNFENLNMVRHNYVNYKKYKEVNISDNEPEKNSLPIDLEIVNVFEPIIPDKYKSMVKSLVNGVKMFSLLNKLDNNHKEDNNDKEETDNVNSQKTETSLSNKEDYKRQIKHFLNDISPNDNKGIKP